METTNSVFLLVYGDDALEIVIRAFASEAAAHAWVAAHTESYSPRPNYSYLAVNLGYCPHLGEVDFRPVEGFSVVEVPFGGV